MQWGHIHLNGSYHFTDITLKGDFRPLREHQRPHLLLSAMPYTLERADTLHSQEEEEMLTPIQLSLFLEEESDL